MAILNISIHLEEPKFYEFLHSLSYLSVLLEPPGVVLYHLLDRIAQGKPLDIFSTGSIRDTAPSALMTDGWDTFFLAKWVKNNSGSTLTVVEIDPEAIKKCRDFLHSHDLLDSSSMSLICGDSLTPRNIMADVAILDSCDGLEHGLQEFKLALKMKTRVIIMDDWDKKVIKAAEYATTLNIPYERVDRYTVFTIPQ